MTSSTKTMICRMPAAFERRKITLTLGLTQPKTNPNPNLQVMICRMFAEFEQRKKQLEAQDAQAKKKAQEEQARQGWG